MNWYLGVLRKYAVFRGRARPWRPRVACGDKLQCHEQYLLVKH